MLQGQARRRIGAVSVCVFYFLANPFDRAVKREYRVGTFETLQFIRILSTGSEMGTLDS